MTAVATLTGWGNEVDPRAVTAAPMRAVGVDPCKVTGVVDAAHERDAELMARVAQGDAGAYRELSNLYLKRVLNYSYRILGSVAEAEEVTQDTFVRLWTSASSWQPRALVSTWLYRVAHNLSIDRLRARKPQANPEIELGSDSVRPSRMLGRRRVAESVQAAIAKLPDRQREALVLSHYEGLGNLQIGAVMGISVEAVESLLGRARRSLRASLSELKGDEDG